MSRAVGAQAETAAARFLVDRGLRLLARNIQCRWGEIDLVLADGAYWVFVEVKARRDQSFGGGLAAITPHKQRRVRRTAEWYLQHQGEPNHWCRIDAVEVDLTTGQCHWIKDAF